MAWTTSTRARGWVGASVGLGLATLPMVGFLLLDAASGLVPATIGAVMAATCVVAIQSRRGRPLGPTLLGLLLTLACAASAAEGGQARAFFVPSLLVPGVALIVCVTSLLVGRPLTGLLLRHVLGAPPRWHANDGLRRIHARATGAAAFISLLNGSAQAYLYLANRPVLLGVVHLLVAPAFGFIVASTVVAVRRDLAGPREEPRDERAAIHSVDSATSASTISRIGGRLGSVGHLPS